MSVALVVNPGNIYLVKYNDIPDNLSINYLLTGGLNVAVDLMVVD